MNKYDAIIIGSGQGGTPLAKRLANSGWRTAIVEKQWIGGTCINTGCTPTKTMIASAKTAYTISKASYMGIVVGEHRVNFKAVMSRKNKVVESFRNGGKHGLKQTENLDLIFGKASFIGEKQIEVCRQKDNAIEITADKIFIDTGGRAAIPEIDGLSTISYLTSSSILELKELPQHLLIIGGGYIGLEFGKMFKRYGSEVTILQNGVRLLPREDEDIARSVHQILEEENIRICLKSEVSDVQKNHDHITVHVSIEGRQESIDCTHVLIATGRAPNTEDLDLQKTGVTVDHAGHIIVNEYLETSMRGIYAIGDVKGGPEFTHISYNDYVILADNILENKKISTHDRMVPYCMFIDPQLGRIGITEMEAEKKGLKYKVTTLPMERVARAVETGDTRGFMKAIVEESSGKILGAAILCQEGGEVMTMLQLAMAGGITAPQLKEMVFAHPLYAESLNNLFVKI